MALYYVGPSGIHGNGVLAKRDVDRNTVIGVAFRAEPKNGGVVVQTTKMGAMVNHSSRPSAELHKVHKGVIDYYYVITIRDLKAGDEISVDYMTTPYFIKKPADLGFRR